MTAVVPDLEQLARLLVHVERSVAGRRGRDIAGPWLRGARCFDVAVLFAVLLPWTTVAGTPLPGYRVSFTLVSVTVVSIVLRQLVRTLVLARIDAGSYRALLTLELASSTAMIFTVPSAVFNQRVQAGDGVTFAPAVYVLALVAATWCAVRGSRAIADATADLNLLTGRFRWTSDQITDRLGRALDDAASPARAHPPIVFAAGVLAYAAVVLLGPWQNGGGPAYQLPETGALRWMLVLAVVAVAASVHRSLTPVVLAASGVALGVLGSVTHVEIARPAPVPFAAIALAALACLLPLVGRRLTITSAPLHPPRRLARATLRLALAAYPCVLLSWTLPAAGDVPVPHVHTAQGTLAMLGPAVIVAAALLDLAVVRAGPIAVRVALLLLTAAIASAGVVVAFGSLDPSDHRYVTGPAGWVCCALYAGVAALALFAGAAMYDGWLDARGRASEHEHARQRITGALVGNADGWSVPPR